MDSPSHALHVARDVIGHAFFPFAAENEPDTSCIDELMDETSGEEDRVADIMVVEMKDVGIFVAHCEYARRACSEDNTSVGNRITDGVQVFFSVAPCLADEPVCDFGDTAATLVFEKPDPIADRIHQSDKIAAEGGIVVVDITSVEI